MERRSWSNTQSRLLSAGFVFWGPSLSCRSLCILFLSEEQLDTSPVPKASKRRPVQHYWCTIKKKKAQDFPALCTTLQRRYEVLMCQHSLSPVLPLYARLTLPLGYRLSWIFPLVPGFIDKRWKRGVVGREWPWQLLTSYSRVLNVSTFNTLLLFGGSNKVFLWFWTNVIAVWDGTYTVLVAPAGLCLMKKLLDCEDLEWQAGLNSSSLPALVCVWGCYCV